MSGDWRDPPWFPFASLTVPGLPTAATVFVDEAASPGPLRQAITAGYKKAMIRDADRRRFTAHLTSQVAAGALPGSPTAKGLGGRRGWRNLAGGMHHQDGAGCVGQDVCPD